MVLDDSIDIAQVHDIIVEKIRGFFAQCGKSKAVVGLSGGIDSALVAALGVEALGKENVHGVLMPSHYSSLHSVSDSVDLAENLGIGYDIIPIEKIYTRFMLEMKEWFEIGKWHVAQENLQARTRGTILMTYSNKFDALVLNTSNKSELFTGYGTLYGDLCGAVMVIADLYKLQVYELSEYINRRKVLIPLSIISKAPSAELHPGQKDSDSLPEYKILDPVLYALHEGEKTPEQLIEEGVDKALVERISKLKKGAAFKAMQIPPVITVGTKPVVPPFKCI